MVDFVGRSRSMLDDMQQWGNYFGESDARAHARWQQNELRQRYDEANRYNREEAMSGAEFQNQNAGVFANTDATLAGLRPQNVEPVGPVRPSGPMSLQPPGNRAAATPAPAPAVIGEGLPEVDVGVDIPREPLPIEIASFANQSQRSAYSQYRTAFRNTIGRRTPSTRPLAAALDTMVRTGVLTQQQANNELYRAARYAGISQYDREQGRDNITDLTIDPMAGIPSANVAIPPEGPADIPADVGLDTGNYNQPNVLDDNSMDDSTGRGLEPPDATDSYFRGTSDTSRGLQPTREMRLLQTSIQDNLRRAQLARQHGRNDVADQAFATALQGQAAYLQQHRNVLYRAATGGSLTAAATLMEEIGGYPEGTVRFRPTDEQATRFYLEVQDDNGNWQMSPQALSRNDLLSNLQNLVDAEGAVARTEANQEYRIAALRAGTDLQVATIQQRTAFIESLSRQAIARMNNQAALAIQMGRGELEFDNENGVAYFHYPMRDEEGNITLGLEVIRMEDQAVPDTNGRETREVPVRERVTGIN